MAHQGARRPDGVGADRYIGYWLGSRFWGRGVGTEALRQFLRAEPVRPLWADPAVANAASVRLLERHGFRPVRTVRHGDNDHVVLGLDTLGRPPATTSMTTPIERDVETGPSG